MKSKNQQRLRNMYKVICRIQSVPCFALGILLLAHLHWDTYWHGLKLILLAFLSWNQDKLWSLVEQKMY